MSISLKSGFEIDSASGTVQCLTPKIIGERFEGIGFSNSGNVLGVATADTNAVLLFRRKANGRFEDEPYSRISGLQYPHDVSFARYGTTEWLAVAQRTGAISIFKESAVEGIYDPDPICVISGADSHLEFSDGVAFVPPRNDYLAACNLSSGIISFYPRTSLFPLNFSSSPEFELKHDSVVHPDGLAFSSCGKWLATANHGGHSVSIFKRRSKLLANGKIRYGPEPTAIITDPELRHPHSVAFTAGGHLVVTNAGANFFSVYRMGQRFFRKATFSRPVKQQMVSEEAVFREVNSQNTMEGGPKGVAIDRNAIAICSPEIGIKLYPFRE